MPKLDIHWLYEAAVQSVDTDLDFAQRVYSKHWTRKPLTLREDFCGTAQLAARWVQRHQKNVSWGIDLHQPTLNWGRQFHMDPLSIQQQKRLHLICEDVLEAATPAVDLVLALNFSFCIFKQRALLRSYFQAARKSLNPEGLFVLDLYGGTESIMEKCDAVRDIPGFTTPQGQVIPNFEYIWDQAKYNPINHHTTCHIHFNVPGYGRVDKAFTYDWRLWTLPEIQEIMIEAGFSNTEVYLHGFDEEGESDEIFRRRKTYENTLGWVAYVIGIP